MGKNLVYAAEQSFDVRLERNHWPPLPLIPTCFPTHRFKETLSFSLNISRYYNMTFVQGPGA